MSPGHHGTSGSGNESTPLKTPDDIMKDVTLLLSDLTAPETQVRFDIPSRANPATIQKTIFPPTATWSWPTEIARTSLEVGLSQEDVGKYGLLQSNHTLYKLVRISPDVAWEAIETFTNASWNWANENERLTQPVNDADRGKVGLQKDIATYYKLTSVDPKIWQQVPNPTNPAALELSTGASDADSNHDFYRLKVAFDDIWSEVTADESILGAARTAYAMWDKIIQDSGDYLGDQAKADLESLPLINKNITGIEELQNFIDNMRFMLGIPDNNNWSSSSSGSSGENPDLKKALIGTIDNLVTFIAQMRSYHPEVVTDNQGHPYEGQTITGLEQIEATLDALPSQVSPPDIDPFTELRNLIIKLDAMMKEPYRFDVFAPGSINYGVLFNYRQRWQPQSYQVGNLVTTIPLAPQETRRYTTKTVVKKTRSVKEIEDGLRSRKDESSNTWREDREIVERAKSNSNFQQNAQGSYGNDTGLYKISAAVEHKQEQGLESAQTKRDFHEAVVKSADEYRTEHKMEVSTEETREDETTSYREIRNPNDELTVTYLFYELQRRYLVSEELHKMRPVILVANEVPAPDEVDEAWILRHDWIIKRAILDNSFLPALEYLSSDYTGEQIKLKVLWMAVEQQKSVVDKISHQVQVAKQALDAATLGLTSAEDMQVGGFKSDEGLKFIKSFFDPLNIAQTGTGGGTETLRGQGSSSPRTR
jgi:hypothetical protein